MSNLIITIISLAIFAVAAIAGMYYGGVAYENAQLNAIANSIMNEAQQILYAERIWSTNNNQPDISGMGTAEASGTGMSALVNGNELSEWPSFGGTIGYSISLTNPGPQPFVAATNLAGTTSTGTYDRGCYSINGYYGSFDRSILSYNNLNYVTYLITINVPYDGTCTDTVGTFYSSPSDVSKINHPMVKIATAINTALKQIPPNAITTYSIGLPLPAAGSTGIGNTAAVWLAGVNSANFLFIDPSGIVQTNYCFLGTTNHLVCTFGPS